MFQTNDCAVGELLFESQNVFNSRPPETVDTLIIVPHNAEIAAAMGQQGDQLILGVVGVLIFVHQDIAKPVLILFQFFRELAEQFNGQINDIIKVQRVGFPQPPLIGSIELGNHHFAVVSCGILQHLLRRNHGILGHADFLNYASGRKLLFRNVTFSNAGFHKPSGVICIVDGKAAVIAQKGDAPAQNPDTGGMEGGGVHLYGFFFTDCSGQSGAHFSGGLVGKGNSKNIPRPDGRNGQNFPESVQIFRFCSGAVLFQPCGIFREDTGRCGCIAVSEIDHIYNTIDNRGCFSAPGTSQYQYGPVYRKNCLLLTVIQGMEISLKCFLF